MKIEIRQTDRHEGQTLQDYRRKQAEAWVARNQPKLRAAFWERKRQEAEAGERFLAEQGQ
jgi:hypothetical protein